VALNCVANSVHLGPEPVRGGLGAAASGDSGTALGGAMYLAHELGDRVQPMRTAALGARGRRGARAWLITARVPYTRPDDIAEEVAQVLADDGVVAWFQGRASTARARSATARCSPTPVTSATSSG
jgi:carbamoyltransferase